MNMVEPVASDAFEVDNLTVGFGEAAGPLRDLKLSLRAGQITCILGQSGCGKTTLLKALGGFVVGDSGGVRFQRRWLEGPTPEIVMIFQENNLYPWLSVRGNVAFGLKFQRPPLARATRRATVERMLADVGLSESASRFPWQLSGGMRQRTAIARALVGDPQVLLLDEPFSALDVALRRRMHALLRRLWASAGKTMVMVTHNIEEALLVGHRVLVLGGRPAQVLIDRDCTAADLKDRYAPAFLALQREIETVIGDDDIQDDTQEDHR